jgi:hypothetical protein
MIQVALIVSIAPTIAALGAVFLGWMNRTKLEDVSMKVDGRLTELLELTRKSSHAEGVADQKDKANPGI